MRTASRLRARRSFRYRLSRFSGFRKRDGGTATATDATRCDEVLARCTSCPPTALFLPTQGTRDRSEAAAEAYLRRHGPAPRGLASLLGEKARGRRAQSRGFQAKGLRSRPQRRVKHKQVKACHIVDTGQPWCLSSPWFQAKAGVLMESIRDSCGVGSELRPSRELVARPVARQPSRHVSPWPALRGTWLGSKRVCPADPAEPTSTPSKGGVHLTSERPISRRRFVAGSLGVVAGGLVGSSGALAGTGSGSDVGPFRGEAADGKELLIGTISDPPAASRIQLQGDAGAVLVAPNARLWKDRAVGVADFGVGDEIVAYGEAAGNNFLAERVEPLYHPVTGRVLAVEGDELSTTGGRVRFVSTSVAVTTRGEQAPIRATDFRRGDSITLAGRSVRGSDVLLVSRVLR